MRPLAIRRADVAQRRHIGQRIEPRDLAQVVGVGPPGRGARPAVWVEDNQEVKVGVFGQAMLSLLAGEQLELLFGVVYMAM